MISRSENYKDLPIGCRYLFVDEGCKFCPCFIIFIIYFSRGLFPLKCTERSLPALISVNILFTSLSFPDKIALFPPSSPKSC